MKNKIYGKLVDIHLREIYPAEISISRNKIKKIERISEARLKEKGEGRYILPPLIDAHMHIESSKLTPLEYARAIVRGGEVACMADPHEIANVAGVPGIEYMVKLGKKTPFKFFWGVSSCVPSCFIDESNKKIGVEEVKNLIKRDDFYFLSEVMDYPGAIKGDKEILAKIDAARKAGKPIDGHLPGVKDEEMRRYHNLHIDTDHESFTPEEAEEKIKTGMKIMVRGSDHYDPTPYIPLIKKYPDKVMLCTDDAIATDVLNAPILKTIKIALKQGVDIFTAWRVASLNTVNHYNIPVGMIRKGDPADFITVESIVDFNNIHTYIDGELVFDYSKEDILKFSNEPVFNNFRQIKGSDLMYNIPAEGFENEVDVRVIGLNEGTLHTTELKERLKVEKGFIQPDPQRDIHKIVLINRYKDQLPVIGFVKGFNLTRGALATSVAHDSHNILAVATNDELLRRVVALVFRTKGAIVSINEEGDEVVLPLPIGGLMSNQDYEYVEAFTKRLDPRLAALSFLSLAVVPDIKITEKGLFSINTLQVSDLIVNG